MKFDPKNLIHQVSPFAAKMFNLLSLYNKEKEHGDVDKDIIKIFDAYDDAPQRIRPEVLQGVIKCYEDTGDRSYLTEAAILILMLDHKHEMETATHESKYSNHRSGTPGEEW